GRQQLFALGLREGRAPEAESLGYGRVLRRRARWGRGKTVGEAALAPGVIGEAALQSSGQFVRCVEDRDLSVLELRQAGLGVPASGPQEHDALVGPVAL